MCWVMPPASPSRTLALTDGVQQSGLAVVDVTHDGDHRRARLEIVLAAFVLAVGEVEGFQQLAVLVLGRHDLHDVVHLAAEQFEGLVTDGLRGGHHLAEVEQRLHQRGRVGVDLLGEVHQRRAAGQPDGLAVAVRQPHATDDGRLHVLVFGAFRPLRLAAALGRTAGTTEGACGAAALARGDRRHRDDRGNRRRRPRGAPAPPATGAAAAVVTAATAAAGTAGRPPAPPPPGPRPPPRAGARPAGATSARDPAGPGGTRRHVARRHAGPRRTGPRGTRAGCLRTRNRPVDRLLGGERVVADARRPRGGLGRTGHRAGPRTGRCAGRRARAAPGVRRGALAAGCRGGCRRLARVPRAPAGAAGFGAAGFAGAFAAGLAGPAANRCRRP